MRILQVSTADTRGGAEKVAWNLFKAYQARGLDSWLAVGEKHGQDPDVFVVPNEQARSGWSRFFLKWSQRSGEKEAGGLLTAGIRRVAGALAEPGRRLDYYRGIEDFRYPGTARLLDLPGKWLDILHAHNLHGYYFDLRLLPWLTRQVPVLLTLHDAWMLSGHCAHSFDCERWMAGCGSCPDLSIYPEIRRDATAFNWRRKSAIYARSRFSVAAPSRWLMNKVERSMLADGMLEGRVIPNGVDLELYQPGDREEARSQLGLSQEAFLLVTAGVQLQRSRWKDYPTLRKALELAGEGRDRPEILCLVLGEDAPVERFGNAEVRFLPFNDEPGKMAQYYRAADAYIHAARADTFPTSVLEAMACGIPVLATGVGGIPEQVEEGSSGFLTQPGDALMLGERVVQLLNDPHKRRKMGGLARERAVRLFGLDRQVEAYLEWYAELLERGRA
jgi:glycosyltransferase involved in cell wall biosynthesis